MADIYTADVTSHGGREGFVRSTDGHFQVKVGDPKEGTAAGTNPEQLFAAAYSACFHSALKSIAKSRHMNTTDSEVEAFVTLHKEDDEYRLSAQLEVAVPGLDAAQVLELAEAAHKVCPYSKATRNNIDVDLRARSTVSN